MLVIVGTLRADGSPGTAGFEFLRTSPFARSAGMGEATTAFAGDALSLYSNPAGLGHVANTNLSAQHVSHYEAIRHSHLAGVFATRHGSWGLGAGMLEVPGITRTQTVDSSRSPDRFIESGHVTARDLSLTLGWGFRQTADFAWGTSVKAVHEQLDSETVASLLLDAGTIYRLSRRWRTALVVQNIGATHKHLSKTTMPPTRVRSAIYNAARRWAVWEADLGYNLDGRWEASLGAEFNLAKITYARFGYRHTFRDADLGPEVGAAMGGGLRIGPTEVNYAFLPFGDLGVSHRLSFCWKLGNGVNGTKN